MNDRLIKESDVLKAIDKRIEELSKHPEFVRKNGHIDVIGVKKHILAIPSADRPQGEWIKFGLGRGTRILFCTNCERRIEVPLSQGDSNYDYCPNCGARMKGADDEVLRKL